MASILVVCLLPHPPLLPNSKLWVSSWVKQNEHRLTEPCNSYVAIAALNF